MIDIHTHILPNIEGDDGPKTIEKSLSMLEMAYSEGVTTVVATPHMLSPLPNRKTEILEAIDKLKNANITLLPGSEIFADDNVLSQPENLITLGDSNYLLIEFPRARLPNYVDEIFFGLQTKGFDCIFAHPERNGSIVEDPNLLLGIIQRGVLIQINAGSILGQYGKASQKTARILLEHSMVHFIASDMHSDNKRFYSLRDAVDEAKNYSENANNLVTINPKTILSGKSLYPDRPLEYKRKRFWFF